MAMTWDRDDIWNAFEGDDEDNYPLDHPAWLRINGADDDEGFFRYVGTDHEVLTLNLTDTGDDDRVAVLDAVLAELNERFGDPALDDGARATVALAESGAEAIEVRSEHEATCPVSYLDALCEDLTARGWTGQLRLAPMRIDPWYGDRRTPTITTVLGLASAEVAPEHLADLMLDWVEAAPGETTLGPYDWRPAHDAARRRLTSLVARTGGVDDFGRWTSGPLGPVVRIASLRAGTVVLTECDPHRPLEDRLLDHRSALLGQGHRVRYGFTTATYGISETGLMHVLGLRPETRSNRDPYDVPRVEDGPYQRPGRTPGLPDAYWSQLFPTEWLDRAHDLLSWRVEVLEHGLVAVTAADPAPWFTLWVDPDEKPDPFAPARRIHDADPDTLAQARTDFGDLLQRPLSG